MFICALAIAVATEAALLRVAGRDYDQKTHVAVPLELAPFAPLLARAEVLNGAKLKTRGEAHLTVVTPPEMEKLSPYRRARLIKELARTSFTLEPVCLGVGEAGGRKTYFVVVDAPEIAKLRRKIGLGATFYPHVTLGFTERDLHESDGVRKNRSACRANI